VFVERRAGSGRPQRVLVVDDAPDACEMWRIWLTSWGFSVEEAHNGSEALQMARRHPPDMIVIDVWMPVMNGLTAIREVRATAHRRRARLVLGMKAQRGWAHLRSAQS
jgi:CheY-like chemotaxis protein